MKLRVISAILLAPLILRAADVLDWEIKLDKPGHIYHAGEEIKADVTMLKNGEVQPGTRFRYLLEGDSSVYGYVWADTDANGTFQIRTRLNRPGAVRGMVFAKNGEGKEYQKRFGVMIDPLQIRTARPKPADFDAYWDRIVAELKALPMKAVETPVPVTNPGYADKVEMFDVRIDTLGDMPHVYGYLCLPRNAKPKSLPAIVQYQGAGFRSSSQTHFQASLGRMVFDINAHGILNGQKPEYYQQIARENEDYRVRGSGDRDTIYFRGMIIRALRALQYIKQRPEWDGRILIVYGGSMGGGQSLAVAGLDRDVTFCLAQVPALADHGGDTVGREGGWPRILRMTKLNPKAVVACDYVDSAFFATRINPDTECLLSVGFFDFVCVPSSVYAAYNAIPGGKKRIITDIHCDHTVPAATNKASIDAVAAHIERMRNE